MTDSSNAPASLNVLWDAFVRDRDEQLRLHLIEHYMPLAKIIAARMYGGRIERSQSFDDYLQYARVGLLESVDRYDPGRSASFESYSTHRIRGAILNGIEQDSELAAQRGFWRTRMPDRLESIAAALPGEPQGASLEDLIDATISVALGLVLESEDRFMDESPQSNPYAAAELAQFTQLAKSLVDQLPPRERDIVTRHYFEHVEFQEIAQGYSITKGRVSQLHARALEQLRMLLKDRPHLNKRL